MPAAPVDYGTVDVILTLSFLAAVVLLSRIVADALLRRRLLNAQASGLLDTAEWTAWSRAEARETALRWACVSIAVGAALVVVDALAVAFAEPVTYGILLIAGGAGLLVYRFSAARLDRRFHNPQGE